MGFNMFEKVDVLGVKIANLTIVEIVDILIDHAKKKRTTCVFTPNSEIIEVVRKDPKLLKLINSADILSADGIGVVYGAKILGNPLKDRAAGFDIATMLLEKGANEGLSFFFFGSKDEVCKKAKENIEKKHPTIKIVGARNGYFSDNDDIASEIAEKNPDIVFVCLGAPKQEKWIYENKEKLNGKILMGLGGCLDVFAGVAKRAPDLYIKLNIEWLYRLAKQPSRFIRMLALPKFLIAVLKSKATKKR
jgi:N-acetylglucosaminyldiphosphoundecaprenol N-acetyl-beta-D-mannosaminyltransferase